MPFSGERRRRARRTRGKGNLGTAKDWDARVDIRRQPKFPEEGSPSQASEQRSCSGPKQVALIELTVPHGLRRQARYSISPGLEPGQLTRHGKKTMQRNKHGKYSLQNETKKKENISNCVARA